MYVFFPFFSAFISNVDVYVSEQSDPAGIAIEKKKKKEGNIDNICSRCVTLFWSPQFVRLMAKQNGGKVLRSVCRVGHCNRVLVRVVPALPCLQLKRCLRRRTASVIRVDQLKDNSRMVVNKVGVRALNNFC